MQPQLIKLHSHVPRAILNKQLPTRLMLVADQFISQLWLLGYIIGYQQTLVGDNLIFRSQFSSILNDENIKQCLKFYQRFNSYVIFSLAIHLLFICY